MIAQDLKRTRDEAREAGDKHYFTGAPCTHGHLAPRYVSSRGCVTCVIERSTTPEAKKRMSEWAARKWRESPEFRQRAKELRNSPERREAEKNYRRRYKGSDNYTISRKAIKARLTLERRVKEIEDHGLPMKALELSPAHRSIETTRWMCDFHSLHGRWPSTRERRNEYGRRHAKTTAQKEYKACYYRQPEVAEIRRKSSKRNADALTDGYIRSLLKAHGSALRFVSVPDDLVRAKRLQVQLERHLIQLKQQASKD